MNKKQLHIKLSRYLECRRRIINNSEEVERLRSCMIKVSSAYRDAPGWDRETSDQAVILDEIEKLTKHIIADAGRLEPERQRTINTIERLTNDNEREVMRLLYIVGCSVDDVEEKLSYSRAQVYRLRDSSMRKLLKKHETK